MAYQYNTVIRDVLISRLLNAITRYTFKMDTFVTLSYDISNCESIDFYEFHNAFNKFKRLFVNNKELKKSKFFYKIEKANRYNKVNINNLYHVHLLGTFGYTYIHNEDKIMNNYNKIIKGLWEKANNKLYKPTVCSELVEKEPAIIYLTSKKKIKQDIELINDMHGKKIFGFLNTKNDVYKKPEIVEYLTENNIQDIVSVLLKLRYPKKSTIRKHLLDVLKYKDKGVNGISMEVSLFIMDYLNKLKKQCVDKKSEISIDCEYLYTKLLRINSECLYEKLIYKNSSIAKKRALNSIPIELDNDFRLLDPYIESEEQILKAQKEFNKNKSI